MKDNEVAGVGNHLSYEARGYDPRTGRWWSIDPHSSTYPFVSPYSFALNSPLRIKDGDGRDIIVLSAPQGAHGFGHAAILIGNDKDGWTYFSKNGTNENGGAIGASDKNPMSFVPYKTLKEFANSEDNFDEQTGRQEYKAAFRIVTSKEIDKKMEKAAAAQVKKDYVVLGQSCVDVPSDALKAGGADPGYSTAPNNDGSPRLNPFPNIRYQFMKGNNKRALM